METEPDIHDRLIRVFQNSYKDIDSKEQSTVNFKSVATEQAIPEKKPPKEILSTEGILKYNWASKHYEFVPSVLVFTVAFSVDWTLSEWVRKESWIQDRFNRLKTLTSARDIKIIVTVIKVGAGATDKESMDERLNSLKRHLQLDSRSFHLLTSHDISTNSTNMKKVSKYVKENSSQYYINKIKSLKTIEKTITEKYKGLDEHILLARFHFKIAFYYEFQTQQLQSLRYYRQSYNSLLNCINFTKNSDLLEQIKIIAEIIHYKICNILLLTNSIGESFVQFKLHIRSYLNISSMYLYKHYNWIANQYIVFAELLQHFSISDALPDADRGYYYQNAARYTQKRRSSFEKINNTTTRFHKNDTTSSTTTVVGIENKDEQQQEEGEGEQYRSSFHGMIILSPRFLGSAIQFEEPMMDSLQIDTLLPPSQHIYTEYLYEQECSVYHSKIIMKLLNLALEMTNYAYIRRRGLLHYLVAEEYLHENKHARALECLKMASELLCEEGWVLPAVSILSLQTKCAILLGRPQEFLDAALNLYASTTQNILSKQELEALHLNIFSLFEASLVSHSIDCTVRPILTENALTMQKFMIQNHDAFLTTSSTPLIYREDYGQACLSGKLPDSDEIPVPVKYCLNADHTVNMAMDKRMFDVQVSFGQKVVELGQSVLVTLSLTSYFIDTVIFDEMKIYFTDKVVVKSLISTDKLASSQHQSRAIRTIETIPKNDSTSSLNEKDTHSNEVQVSNTDAIYTSLAFPAKQEKTFSFYIYISEPCFGKFTSQDAILCLERVELCWYSQTRRKELGLPEEISTQNTTNTTSEVRSAAIVLNINAFPISLQRAQEEVTLAAGKPQSLKDLVGFCADECFDTVTVRKPNALISIVDPLQNVNLLQGVMQRVNVFLKLGQTDVLDGYVYLSSDHEPTGSSDALFWYPDKLALAGCVSSTSSGTGSGVVEDSALDRVPFYPIALGVTMQPEQPIHIPAPTFHTGTSSSNNNNHNSSSSDTIICVPLFLKSESAKTVTISLRVEFIPKGILRSSLSKDFTITTNFLSPFDVRYALGRDGSMYDAEGSTLKSGPPSLLSTSLVCLNSLQHAIGVVDMEISSSTRKDVSSDSTTTTATAGSTTATGAGLRFVTIAHGPQDHATLFHSETPLPLRSQELVTKSVHIQHIPATSSVSPRTVPFYEQFTAKKDVTSAPGGTIASSAVVSSGQVDVRWRILQTHILRRPFSSLSALAESPRHSTGGLITVPADSNVVGNPSWLLSLGGRDRRAESATESPRGASKHSTETTALDADMCYLDRSISAFTVCRSTFPLPDIKVQCDFIQIIYYYCSHTYVLLSTALLYLTGGRRSLRHRCDCSHQLRAAGPGRYQHRSAQPPVHTGACASECGGE